MFITFRVKITINCKYLDLLFIHKQNWQTQFWKVFVKLDVFLCGLLLIKNIQMIKQSHQCFGTKNYIIVSTPFCSSFWFFFRLLADSLSSNNMIYTKCLPTHLDGTKIMFESNADNSLRSMFSYRITAVIKILPNALLFSLITKICSNWWPIFV